MKKLFTTLLTLAACAAVLCVTAAAASPEPPTKVGGTVSPWDGDGIFLKGEDEDNAFNEVVLNVGENTYVVDAESGLPMDLEDIQEGGTVHAWIGPAATMSLPPQVFPIVVVGNIQEEDAAPEFCQITGFPAQDENGGTQFPLLGGGTLTVGEDTSYTPWLTRQMVRVEDLVPGAEILVWKNQAGTAEKVVLFAYGYRGYVTGEAMPHGDLLLSMNGDQIPELPYKRTEDALYLPLRAVAEAAGYSVSWDKNRGAVVQDENVDLVFFAVPGEQVIFRDGEEVGISAPCILENGVTYLPAEDLCYWLDLFFCF